MTPPRALISGDRVKITGPHHLVWTSSSPEFTGLYATVYKVLGKYSLDDQPIQIEVDGQEGLYWWCRDNLRALPRRK